MNNIAE